MNETKADPRPTDAVPEGQPDESKPVTLRNMFKHPDSHPVALAFAMGKAFGPEWIRWVGETITEEVEKTFSTQVSALCRAKLRAVQACLAGELPWQKWQVFEKVVQAFNSNLPDTKVVQIPTPEVLMAGVDMLSQFGTHVFSTEVRLYIAAALLDDDLFLAPEPLDFVQVELSQPLYTCKDCGTTETGAFHDGVCSHCADRLHPEHGLSLKPKEGKGRNVEVRPRFDPDPVHKRWLEVRSEEHPVLSEDDPRDVQCAKLLAARDYMNMRRAQLVEQLTMLKAWVQTP